MASPFEYQSPQLGDSVHRRREEFRFRSQKRSALTSKKLNTRWKPMRDILWQRNPDRILKYRPSHLHYYGWIPFAVLRNWKATVFSEVYLYVQNLVLLAWMAALHLTGLGVPNADLATLVAMFGTPYLGAIFNYGMVVVFILGLFITLVINRWWTIRGAYTKLMGTTTDLCMMVVSSIQNPQDEHDKRISRARKEITRLLNLGHLLVIAKADALNEEFKKSYGLRTAYRNVTSSLSSYLSTAVLTKSGSVQSSPRFAEALYKPRNLLTFDTMVNEGFMNRDEWDIIVEGEREGMPGYHLVYYWTQCLINKCRAAEWIVSAPQMLPLMLNKINAIVESGTSIITTINSQMPYPYVHLVSLVVHVYLIVLATWFGCFLRTGRLGETFLLAEGERAIKATDDVDSSVWMVFWCYLLMTVANVTFQGLLDMHTLLDNPFGNHCTKFALRANVSTVTNASRTMLMFADKFPAAFGDVFQQVYADADDSVPGSTMLSPPSMQEYADFLNPRPTGQFPLGSIGSWPTADNDRSSRPSVWPKEKKTADRTVSTLSPYERVQSIEEQRAPPPTRFPYPAQEGLQLGERGALPETTEEPPTVISQSSGDAAIQRRYLEGVVRHSMEALTSRSNSQSGSPSRNAAV